MEISKMTRSRAVSIAATVVLMLSVIAMGTPEVSATNYRIVLPFWTGWEELPGMPMGRMNTVDWKTSDFYGYLGPDYSPELDPRDSGYMGVTTPLDGTVFGYDFGNKYLMAAGKFGSSYSFCYFDLFDETSDYQTPFRIKPHTFISIWYYHHQLRDCMIDAELYNQVTGQYWTLRDFNLNGQFITDQNGFRLHPAYRYNDPVRSWQLASFDLSLIYDSSPGNWWVTKIWIAFDNGVDHATGQALTGFDLLHISYGIAGSFEIYGDTVAGSIIAWEFNPAISGTELRIKVTIAAHTIIALGHCPKTLKVSVDQAYQATALTYPNPTGVNLQDPDGNWPSPEVADFIWDCVGAIIGKTPLGIIYTVAQLAYTFYGLVYHPPTAVTYQWPDAPTTPNNNMCPTYTLGEAYILVHGIASGLNIIPVTFTTDFYDYIPIWFGGYWEHVRSEPVTLYFPFNTQPETTYMRPRTPSAPWGDHYSGYRWTLYTFNTKTTDPNDDQIENEFDWGDGSSIWTSSHNSGEIVSASHKWNAIGAYHMRVRARDATGRYSDWSSSTTMNIINKPGNPCPTLFAWDGSNYLEIGILDIHAESDITFMQGIEPTLVPEYQLYKLSLRELDEFTSHINYVKLYIIDNDVRKFDSHLVNAVHSEVGHVENLLLQDDSKRVDLNPQQTLDLRFTVPHVDDIGYFIFEISGYNIKP